MEQIVLSLWQGTASRHSCKEKHSHRVLSSRSSLGTCSDWKGLSWRRGTRPGSKVAKLERWAAGWHPGCSWSRNQRAAKS